MAHGGEAERFHLDVENSRRGAILEKLEFGLLIVIAKGAIESPLAFERTARQ